ncbi:MAG: hypothetical protein ITG07_16340 [Candidimonas sp.]|nr:hypothetical protein [Candidimonas sp.]
MVDIDCHSDIIGFHDDEVTLPAAERKDMRERRDVGRDRLTKGLDTAGKPQPKEMHSQGSYQMRTMVQDPDCDYDIDDGAYFAEEDLQDDEGVALSPLAARQRVCDALAWDGRFKQSAEVRDNCVRQPYAIGYHIDVPVYRVLTEKVWTGDTITKYELASGDSWVISDARKVTKWFNDLVGELNSGEADGSQMRRVTKLTKKFARRADWKDKATSGITITKLVVDNFSSNSNRDDIALRETWKNIYATLLLTTKVAHPVNPNNLAEDGDEKVAFFRDCLKSALDDLLVLDDYNCTRADARSAWDRVFDTTHFSSRPDPDGGAKGVAPFIEVTSSGTAQRDDGGGRFG